MFLRENGRLAKGGRLESHVGLCVFCTEDVQPG
jgi:hypothetical protein